MSRAAWLRERLRRESPLVAPRCALLEAGRRFEPELPPDA